MSELVDDNEGIISDFNLFFNNMALEVAKRNNVLDRGRLEVFEESLGPCVTEEVGESKNV